MSHREPEDEVDRATIMRKIGVAQKVFSTAQWKEAEQAARDGDVGKVLVARGVVTADQLRALERAVDFRIGRNEDKELGKVIVDSGYADATAVEAAMERQKELYNSTGRLHRLADILLEDNSLTASQSLAARKILGIAKASRGSSQDPDD